MFLYNDVQQWWYVLVSTLAIFPTIGFPMVWNSFYCTDGNQRWWWRRTGSCSVIWLCLPTWWRWYIVIEEEGHERWRWYYLNSTFAVPLTIGAILHSIFSRYRLNDDNHLEIFLKEREGGLSFWLLTIWGMTIFCIGGTAASFTFWYLSRRSWFKSITINQVISKERDCETSVWP